MRHGSERDRQVRRVLIGEGLANASVLSAKTVVGLSTGSAAVLGDAIHSLADLANNGIGLVATRMASEPADADHPYGHAKFETLAVFALATLLAVLAVEIALRGLRGNEREIVSHGWGLGLMLGVLVVNTGLAVWEGRWARRLDSPILEADARHTLSDVLVTLAVIAGWQLAASGYAWLDTAISLGVAALILSLAWGLFRRAIPILVDHSAVEPERLAEAVQDVVGVRRAMRVRSRGSGASSRVEVTVAVDGSLSTEASHAIADEVERVLAERFAVEEVNVHVEPER